MAIAERAISLIDAHRPASVALYWPIGSECATQALIAKVEALGLEIGLPAVADGTGLVFRRYRPGDRLVAGVLGTREPAPAAPLVRPEFFVLPVVAFDRSGMRLGYGRGYYDSAISGLRDAGQQPKLLGIAFSVQEVEAIPAEPHDVYLDFVVTEKETLEFRTSKG
jgi:5-formyltetrahydrofolate cyclo-ligase